VSRAYFVREGAWGRDGLGSRLERCARFVWELREGEKRAGGALDGRVVWGKTGLGNEKGKRCSLVAALGCLMSTV
jgi:hypothetical protein